VGGRINLAANSIIAMIDKETGMLVSWKIRGRELLASPLRLNFWRPPVNNDEGAKLPRELAVWRRAGADAKAVSVEVRQDGADTVVDSRLRIPAGESEASVQWRMHPSGRLSVAVEFSPKGQLPMIPRVGMQCALTAIAANTVTWFGKGPHESYVDRKSGAWTAVHSGVVPQLFHRYLDPQEAGNRTEVRWARIMPAFAMDGFRVDATGDSLLSISLYPASPDDIELARHPSDLRTRDRVFLNLDHLQMGLGGTNSWGEQPLDRYRIKPSGDYAWSFLITPQPAVPSPEPSAPGP
jgi:beta-galactosidase